ncbi:MAG: hypothetical protein ACM3SP_11975 [Chloroflexota bacterium]
MESSLIFRVKEHRGCDIRAASYAAGPQRWIPEACVSLQTDDGSRRVWLRSFVHCFDSENITFRNKLEADNWAFDAARAIIDRALPEFDPISSPRVPLCTNHMSKLVGLARRPLKVLWRFGVVPWAD